MKCRNCGAEITLTQRFCPNCGSPNEQSKQHIDDMAAYNWKFSKTREEVVSNSKWFVKYIAPLTTLVITVVCFSFIWVADKDCAGYDIAKNYIEKQNAKNGSTLSENCQKLLENGEYAAVFQLYSRIDYQLGDKEHRWYDFYTMTSDYQQLRASIFELYDPALNDNYSTSSGLNKASGRIYDIQYTYYTKHSYSSRAVECEQYMDQVKEHVDTFLKGYCNFTDSDIEAIKDKDSNYITALLAARMNVYEVDHEKK